METKRQLDVLDQRLSKNDFISGQNYNIADIAIWSWYGQLVLGELYNADVFLDVAKYQHVMAWAKKIDNREAVKRGKIVNQSSSDKPNQLRERHDMSDFDFLK